MTDKKFPTELIDLPSNGWFYPPNSPLASGQVEMKYLTAREEDILTSTNLIQKGVVLDKLLESLIVTEGVSHRDLLIGDKNGLLIAARIMGYGKEYPVSVVCPACGIRQNTVIDLQTLDVRGVPEPENKGKNEFKFKLPYSKKELTFKLLTQRDEEAIEEEVAKLGQLTEIDKTRSTRLKHIITAVDGDSNPQTIRDFVDDEFLSRDTQAFRAYYEAGNPNIDMSAPFCCEQCEAETNVVVPIGLGFFWPEA